MAAIQNDMDLLLQATVPRFTTVSELTNAVTVCIYQRKADATIPPALPTADCTYTFTPADLTGLDNGWTFHVPVADMLKPFLFISTAICTSHATTGTIIPADWNTPQVLARDGQTGPTGMDAIRSPVHISASVYTAWDDATANAVLAAAGYGTPINRDMVTLFGPTFSQTKFWDNTDGWLNLDAYIDGNLLVTGTLSAAKITTGQMTADRVYGGTLEGAIIKFGTGHTYNGKAFEILSSGTVWVDNLFGGVFSADNYYYGTINSIEGWTSRDRCGIFAGVSAVASSPGGDTHAFVAHNYLNGAAGRIGTSDGYDFYADGSGTNYGPFTGAHDALAPNGTEFTPGDMVVDVECLARNGLSNTICLVEPSSKANQAGVVGVFVRVINHLNSTYPAVFVDGYTQGVDPTGRYTSTRNLTDRYHELKDDYQVLSMNALGEGQINVCGEGGAISVGDLIVSSSITGKGMKQGDNIVRNYTVARSREAVTFSSPSEVKQIACIYLCG